MASPSLENILKVHSGSYPPVQPDIGANFTRKVHCDTYDFISQVNCTGKAVLITAANKGIGKALASAYARAGASHIGITCRSGGEEAADEIKSAAASAGRSEPSTLVLPLDVTDSRSVKEAALRLDETWGRLDILINNAGFLAKFETILDGDEDEWWRSYEVNVRGAYLVTKAFLPVMLKGGDKTILTMSSTGVMHYHAGASSYQTSKFALLRLSEYFMADYADRGVLSYSVHPGGVMTDLSSKLPQKTQAWLKCTPQLAGDTIAFLTSERREWLAGRYMSVMWDMQELLEKKTEIIEKDLLKMKMAF